MQHRNASRSPGAEALRLDRRALLAGLGSIPIIGAAAVAAADDQRSSPDHADAELLALGREFDAVFVECEPIREECNRLVDIYNENYPPPPAGLLVMGHDMRLGLGRGWQDISGRWLHGAGIVEELRDRNFSSPEVAERAKQIVAAWDERKAASDRLTRELGLDVVEVRCDALLERLSELAECIVRIEAKTLAGLAVKARVALWLQPVYLRDVQEMRDDGADDNDIAAVDLMHNIARLAAGQAVS